MAAGIDFPWLRPLWQQLAVARSQQQLPHGIGLPWRPDAGIEAFLDAFVAWLLCQEHRGQACGLCKSCLLYKAGTHPDYVLIKPEAGKKIGVEAIRQLHDKVWQRSSQSGETVVVIQQAEHMTEAAANALLKTLEEPPPQNYLIVMPERFSRLLPTVRSRLTTYPLPVPNADDMAEWLMRHGQLAKRPDDSFISEAQLNPLKVLKRLQGESAEQVSVFKAVYAGEQVIVPDSAEAQGEWLDNLLRELQRGLAEAQGDRVRADSIWPDTLSQHPHVAGLLPQWYQQVMQIKRELGGSGLNAKLLVQRFLSAVLIDTYYSKGQNS
ncbi:MAG: hypothetical protein JJU10_04890 [Idiomarina sp.]|nr:hypothetical protein [Idiomarina sp.]